LFLPERTDNGLSLPIEPVASSPFNAIGSMMNLKSSWV